jgi:hypothetical protein
MTKLTKFSELKSVRTVSDVQVTIGADPELFIKRSGRAIGSEKVINENSHVIEDGVQAELQPLPSDCRERFQDNIAACLKSLKKMVSGKRCNVSPDILVDVSKSQYDSLSEKNKEFGCGISHNAHGFEVVSVDPSKYLKRSAGGHMHFGEDELSDKHAKILTDAERVIPILDIMVGNTLVLLDRDKGNKERRKYYGLAGEYRINDHGIEYRTPSNFWLRAKPLMSLAFGLARHGINICFAGLDKQLLSLVDMKDITRAINNNNYALAKRNFNKYKEFIVATAYKGDDFYPINNKESLAFFERIVKDGADEHFPQDIMGNWLNTPYILNGGWSSFRYRLQSAEERERQRELNQNTRRTGCGI